MAHTESLPISLTRRDAAGLRGDRRFTVVWLAGEHDPSTNVALAAVIDRASELDNADMVIDLSGVTFMDASIVGTLIAARNRLAKRSLSLQLRALSPVATRLLARCGRTDLEQLPPILPLHPTGAASALGTWVDVRPQPAAAGAKADAPEPTLAEAERGAS
jgi:anti-sigma B factor antagonist